MQPLESRLAELKARLHGARPIGQQVDGLRGVISRCQKRIAEAEIAIVEAEASSKRQRTSRVTRLNLRNSSHSLLHLRCFARQMDRTAGCQSGLQTLYHQSPNTCRRAAISTETQLHNPFSVCWSQHLHQMRCGVEHWTILPTCAMCRIAGASTRAVQTGHITRTKCGSKRRRWRKRRHNSRTPRVDGGECRQTHDCHHQRSICHLRRSNQSSRT